MTTSTIRFRGMFSRLRSTRRRYKAVDYVREHIARLNKSGADSVKISPKLNERIMRIITTGDPVKVDITRSGEIINVKLAGETVQTASDQQAKPKDAAAAAKPEIKLAGKQETKPATPKEDKPKESTGAEKPASGAHKVGGKPPRPKS